MKLKPVALPRPRRPERAALDADEHAWSAERKLQEIIERRAALAYELELLDVDLELFAIESICGGVDDTQDVELYDGTLGVTREFVAAYERPVGQLQWLDDLHTRFTGPSASPGDVSGERWGSGGLCGPDLFLTAGHCFDPTGGGWQRPRRNGVTIEPAEIATLMRVNFGYQVNAATGQLRPGVAFPVTELIDYRESGLDFAIVRLGPDDEGRLPGHVYGALQLAADDLTTADAMLCMIQHPSGRPKRIEAGPLHSNLRGRIAYDSLDTEGGSSGAPILGPAGEVVGVHTNGGCSRFSGANYGVSIGVVRDAASALA